MFGNGEVSADQDQPDTWHEKGSLYMLEDWMFGNNEFLVRQS